VKSKAINPPLTATYPQADTDQVPANLGRIADALERLVVVAERLSGVPQRPEIGALLAAIHARVGDAVFVSPELVEFALVAAAEELRDAILAAVGSLNPRRLGRRFAEVEGEEHDGYRLRRVGADRDGICWQVVRVSESANPPSSVSARGIA